MYQEQIDLNIEDISLDNNDNMNLESEFTRIRQNKYLKLSKVSIIALDIIIKELTNVFYHTLFTSDEIKETLLQEISNYLQNKETYALTYTSKKAIEIIKLQYININIILCAISNHLSKEDEPAKINKKRLVETSISNISNLVKKKKYEK